MTKKAILLIPLLLLCFNIFAQETKPWLFIGYYDTAKGICGDRICVREEIKDLAEYKIRSQQFKAEHIGFSPNSEYVTEKQCVIICEFTTNRSVFKCFPKGTKAFKSYTIEDCRKLMEEDRILFEKNRSVQPKSIYERQAIGGKQKQTVTEDFGGVAGKFYLVGDSKGVDIVVAQLSNKTSNKLATVLLQTEDGKMMVEYINPGEVLTKKYNTKKLEIQVLYQDSNKPKPESTTIYNFVKDKLKKIITNENGKVESSNISVWGVRG